MEPRERRVPVIPPKDQKIRLLIDSDAKNETDDQWAIALACWDILGKSLGVPVWQLLGGKHRDQLRVYANGWYRGPRDPAFFAEEAAKLIEN